MSNHLGDIELVHRSQDSVASSSHSRSAQCSGRQTLMKVSTTLRMGVEQSCSSQDFPDLGTTHDRSVCQFTEQEAQQVLFSVISSPGRVSGCLGDELEECLCLCLFTSEHSQPSSPEGGRRERCCHLLIAPAWTRRELYPLLLSLPIAFQF